ncbi:MAG: phosphate ABC transporter substrate-binding protein PstS [Bdellovibrionaceae bacterium]|nr:phosphate ABC transporter substrate-binding protein PstS [Pseudobdellovibrionaceae bacterium]
MTKLSQIIFTGLLLAPLSAFAAPVLVNGAGATFPYPLYAKWFSTYRQVDPTVEINYQSIGSGGGIRQFLAGTTDFGASDAPMKDSDLAKAKTPILHIPTTLGAVAVTYNVPGLNQSLNVTSDVLARIFMGEIKKWDDEAIQKLNPKAKLPKNQFIVVCYRSDGSGTTSIFTDYLAKVSPEWKSQVGQGKSVKWPTGLGGKGNEGVTGLVKQNPGAIGYVEMTYASTNKLPVFAIQNKKGEFISPSVAAVSLAAAGALETMPDDYRVSITDAAGKGTYPIAAFTYLLVHQQMENPKGEKLVKFLRWAMDQGQRFAPDLNYAPLPKSLISKVNKTIGGIKTGAMAKGKMN